MSKADRAKARRKNKAAFEAAVKLAPTPKRGKDKCFVERTRQQDSDPDPIGTVLSARCRRLGKRDTPENRLALKGDIFGDPAGEAIFLAQKHADDAQRIWKVFCGLDQADEKYHRRILGTSRFAKCAKVEFIPERFEARPDEKADTRTEDEKDAGAVNAWMWWHGQLGHLPAATQTAIWDGVYLRKKLQERGKLTVSGAAFASAAKELHDVIQGSKNRR